MHLPGCLVIGALLLSGCSLFAADSAPDHAVPQPPALSLTAALNSNLSPGGIAQPTRVCVWQRAQPGFIPDGVFSGATCQLQSDANAPLFNDIIAPGMQRSLHLPATVTTPFWLVIGAEFQQYGSSQSLIEIRVANADAEKIIVSINDQTLAFKIYNKD